MIYLDSAATTLQKPPSVAAAVLRAMRTCATPGRGGHPAAMRAAETVFRCRTEAAEFFHAPGPEQVVFTLNATHALNLAVHSLVKPGDTVLISGYEHNSVLRPLCALDGVRVEVARSAPFDGAGMLAAFREKLDTCRPAAVFCTHVSNVFGFVLPVGEIAGLCRERGVPIALDASQSAGVLEVDQEKLGAAFVAMPGHKSLYGPQGTGILLCGEGSEVKPLLAGGTGSNSALREMPDFLPDRAEAGTVNTAGIAGLLEGIRFVRARGLGEISAWENRLRDDAARRLGRIPGVEVFAAEESGAQSGVLSFRVSGMDCERAAEELGARGICVRAGLHCAPLAHESAGTADTGTIRASFSLFNRPWECRELGEAVAALVRKSPEPANY